MQNKTLTRQQQKSLHLFFSLLAEELNTKGKDMRVILKPTWQIWWTPQAVKRDLWKPLQKAMYGKESTTDLLKHEEIDKIHETIMHYLGEKHEIEYIEFPHMEHGEEDEDGRVKLKDDQYI